jgi:hypothetical protein
MDSCVLWRVVRAPLLARAGHLAEAEALARSAVSLALQTEAVDLQADALAELAGVLKMAGKAGDARGHIADAIHLFSQKGNVVAAGRARAFRVGLDDA